MWYLTEKCKVRSLSTLYVQIRNMWRKRKDRELSWHEDIGQWDWLHNTWGSVQNRNASPLIKIFHSFQNDSIKVLHISQVPLSTHP